MKTKYIIGIILLVCFIILFIVGSIQSIITYNQCKEDCKSTDGCITFQRISNGDFNLRDTCIIYFKEGSRTYILNEKWRFQK